jgi:Tol biopolymer transport system component
LLAWPAFAGREPVLRQVQVPHSYYYREMYLPQVTSGPGAAAWSPDGRELVYSMQGTLWRQALDSTTAVQLTDGPGYDHQPDWSPDGTSVVYASYHADAVELRLLDLASGQGRALTANGAVNVEPRFSPDGRRIAFVSTAHNGRWHLFVVPAAGGAPERLTGDVDSGLPRYYYSRFDHELSPTWSPDGGELLFVSNRGRIWGSGGFWRMKATPGAAAREIRYEETNWKARPDWSRDGRRVVYSSYLGRQWNQLWLMTDEGGDPFPITYGEHDATAPRWSPDATRIAYVSNETGDASLWVIEVPGGKRSRLEARERRYRGPVGTLVIEVLDSSTGRPTPARVSVIAGDGRGYGPDDAWRHADDGFDRGERAFEHPYFHSAGTAEVTVPAGRLRVEVTHGLESRPFREEVLVEAGERRTLRVALSRIADLRSQGYFSGDLHVHMNYGGTYRNDTRGLARQMRAEDLDVVENLIVNKEQRVPDVQLFDRGRPDPGAAPDLLIVHGQEYHTSFWGHTALLGLDDHILLPAYAAYVNTAAQSLYPDNATVLGLARAQNALVGYVHPFDAVPDLAKDPASFPHNPNAVPGFMAGDPVALPVDVALGRVDYLEVVGFSLHRPTAEVWYRLLNCGFRIPAGAGTDAMANYASLRGPVGMSRVYARLDGPLDRGRWLQALRAGRTMATNGPLVQLSLQGRQPGDELKLPAGRHRLEARVSLRSIVPVDHLEIVGPAGVVAALPLAGDGTSADLTHVLAVGESGWYTLRAWADGARHPVLDRYPFGTTSPIYVTVGDAPVRSARDAAYFAAWIDRLRDAVSTHDGWNAPREKEAVTARLLEARAVYERLQADTMRPAR